MFSQRVEKLSIGFTGVINFKLFLFVFGNIGVHPMLMDNISYDIDGLMME